MRHNPDIHMICGKCGCATMFDFKVNPQGNDNDEMIYPAIFITCNNCGTLTGLDNIIEDKTDWKNLSINKNGK